MKLDFLDFAPQVPLHFPSAVSVRVNGFGPSTCVKVLATPSPWWQSLAGPQQPSFGPGYHPDPECRVLKQGQDHRPVPVARLWHGRKGVHLCRRRWRQRAAVRVKGQKGWGEQRCVDREREREREGTPGFVKAAFVSAGFAANPAPLGGIGGRTCCGKFPPTVVPLFFLGRRALVSSRPSRMSSA